MSKAMKLALEALEWANKEINEWRDDAYGYDAEDQPIIMAAITALRLEIDAQNMASKPAQQALDKKAENARELGLDYEPAQQEPVGTYQEIMRTMIALRTGTVVQQQAYELMKDKQLYTSPPAQRTWVGLTDEQISDCMDMSIQKTCRAIEAKLKEKNT
jgi:hypothetical protein